MKNRTSLLAGTMILLALTVSQSLAQSSYEPYTFSTLAGNYRNADGTGSAARFWYPCGIAIDSAGNYVADTVNNTIRKGYPENVPVVIVTSAPGFGFGGGQFGFSLTGPAGQLVVVEASTDLVSWLPLWTNTFAVALGFNDRRLAYTGNSEMRYERNSVRRKLVGPVCPQRAVGRGLQRCGALGTDAPYPFPSVAHLPAQAVYRARLP
jgi:hypothetical protein